MIKLGYLLAISLVSFFANVNLKKDVQAAKVRLKEFEYHYQVRPNELYLYCILVNLGKLPLQMMLFRMHLYCKWDFNREIKYWTKE